MGNLARMLATALWLPATVLPAQAQTNTPAAPANPALGAGQAAPAVPTTQAAQNANAQAVISASAATLPIPPEARNRIAGYTAWDDDYLYLAFQVNKPILNGTLAEAFTDVLKSNDDAVIVSLQTDDNRTATTRTPRTVTLVAGAGGGSQLYTGPALVPLFTGLQEVSDRLSSIITTEKDPKVQETRRTALFGSIYKVQVTKSGAVLPSGSNANGYTVEVAIPWSDLGGKPAANAKMGIVVAARSPRENGGSPALQTLTPAIKTPADLDNPSLWTEIVFANAPTPSTPMLLVSPRIFAGKPVIDGEIGRGEWNGLSEFIFGERGAGGTVETATPNAVTPRTRPEVPTHAPRPVVPPDTPDAATAPDAANSIAKIENRKPVVPSLVFAGYHYEFQADPRKAVPMLNVTTRTGTSALAHHPLQGVGPWLSFDRMDWHANQLTEARRAGIDVLLPVYRPSLRDRQQWAEKGLTVLAGALESLRSSGQDYPQIGCCLDTVGLSEFASGSDAAQKSMLLADALFAAVRDFYARIPAPFRCTIPLSGPNVNGSGGASAGRAYPVFLLDGTVLADLDAAAYARVRARFAAAFGGAGLILVGGPGFKPDSKLDGYFGDPNANGIALNTDGTIKIAALCPGYDPTVTNDGGKVLPYRNGDTYREAWTRALANRPDWIVLEDWNDYAHGAEIGPTLENGLQIADLTRISTRRFAGDAKFAAKYLAHDVTARLVSGVTYAVHLRAQNTGTQIWANLPPIDAKGNDAKQTAFAYRWKRNGQTVAVGASAPLAFPALSGQNADVTVPVAVSANGAKLPDGDYMLEISPVEIGKNGQPGTWAGDVAASSALTVAVHVASAETGGNRWAATLVRTDLPTMLESGSLYDVRATLRNDGTRTWRKADGARVTLRMYRRSPLATVNDGSALPSFLTDSVVATTDATMELPRDVLPGQEIEVRVPLALATPDGTPLPVYQPDELVQYVARWEIAADGPNAAATATAANSGGNGNGAGNASGATVQTVAAVTPQIQPAPDTTAQGVSIAPTPVSVVESDFGARFTSDLTPPTLPGERRQPVTLSVQNTGPQTWNKNGVRVGYHWYYADGTEFLWEDETTAIGLDVKPGQTVSNLLAYVTAPPYDGTYRLVWDVKVGNTWASTTASSRLYDESARTVQVIGGRLVFADLTKNYNIDGVSDTKNPADGDLDGQGRTFPAALVPPFADAAIVPSGIWNPATLTGPDSPRRIAFRWGGKERGEKNFIECRGQRLELGKNAGKCRLLHLLAASTGREKLTDMKLVFQEPTSESEDLYAMAISPWNAPPTYGEEVALLARYHHERSGVTPGAVALYHYIIKIHDPRKLIAVKLPNAPDVKIAAITLEK